jgi:hypothetical protein
MGWEGAGAPGDIVQATQMTWVEKQIFQMNKKE